MNKFLLCILVFAVILYIFALNPRVVGEIYDDGAYILLAKSLITGKGFPSSHFPIGFPAILAPILKLFPQFPQNIIPLKGISIGITILFLVCIYLFFTRANYTGSNTALLIVLLTAINPNILNFSVQVMSEMSYSLFVILALMFTEKCLLRCHQPRTRTTMLLGALFVALAFLTRTIGIALVLALVIYSIMRQGIKKSIPFLITIIIFISPWIWYTLTQETTSYIPEFRFRNIEYPELGTIGGAFDLIIRVGNNLWSVITRGIGGIIFPFSVSKTFLNITTSMKLPFLYPLLQLLFSLVVLIGFFNSFQNRQGTSYKVKMQNAEHRTQNTRHRTQNTERKNWATARVTPTQLYIIFYIGVVLIWPFPPDRYLIPITPFLFYYFIYGVRNHRFCIPRIYFYILIVVLIISSLKRDIGYIYSVHKYGHEGGKEAGIIWNEKMKAYKWIKENTPQSAVVVTLHDVQLNLYTGRKAIRALGNIDELLKADYVVLVPYGSAFALEQDLSQNYFLPVLAKHRAKFELVYRTQHTSIYKVKYD